MQVKIITKSNKVINGKILSKGFFNVDQPECYEVEVAYGVLFFPCGEIEIKEIIDER